MKNKMILTAICASILSVVGLTLPAIAEEITPRDLTSSVRSEETESTFELEQSDSDTEILKVGQNRFIAGMNVMSETETNGLLFISGNNVGVKAPSEYDFMAGNILDFSSSTKKDLFAAGNYITIHQDARVGRDVFAAGNVIKIDADLPGSVSVAARKLVLNDIKIDGNVDLSVGEVIFQGKTEITGKLSINNDAYIDGISNVTYAEIEKYEVVVDTATATEIFLSKVLSIIALFVTFVIIMALFPAIKDKVSKEVNYVQFGKDLFIGLCTLLFVPLISIFLIMSIIGAPAGLILIVAYVIMIYLSQAFTGVWLGELLVNNLFHSNAPAFVKLLLGITLVIFVGMLPFIGWFMTLLAIILGLGLFMQAINPSHKNRSGKGSSHDKAMPTDIPREDILPVEPKQGKVAKDETVEDDEAKDEVIEAIEEKQEKRSASKDFKEVKEQD